MKIYLTKDNKGKFVGFTDVPHFVPLGRDEGIWTGYHGFYLNEYIIEKLNTIDDFKNMCCGNYPYEVNIDFEIKDYKPMDEIKL